MDVIYVMTDYPSTEDEIAGLGQSKGGVNLFLNLSLNFTEESELKDSNIISLSCK